MATVKELKNILRVAKQTTPTCEPYSKLNKAELEARVKALNIGSKDVQKKIQILDKKKAEKKQMMAEQKATKAKSSQELVSELTRIMKKMNYSIVKDNELELVKSFVRDSRNKKKPIYNELVKALKEY